MPDSTLEQRYRQLRPLHEQLKSELEHILSAELGKRKIQIHAVEGRVKEFDSLARKLSHLDAGHDSDLESISDLCGVRVICLFRSDIQRIGEMLEKLFEIDSKEDKVTSIPQEQFGYMSTHYLGTFPTSYSGPRYDDIQGLRFEIQVRTIAMHSWATISHYVDYKSSNAIPSELRKDFYALSALFYLADSQFETFYKLSQQGREELKDRAAKSDDISEQEINLDSLSALMKMRYPEREHGSPTEVSDLVDELVGAGFVTIGEIIDELDRSEDAFSRYEQKYPPTRMSDEEGLIDTTFMDIGLIRCSLSISNVKYREFYIDTKKTSDKLVKQFKELEQFVLR